MFPKTGKTFPNEEGPSIERLVFQAAIAAASKRELGGSHRAVKTVMKWTGVSNELQRTGSRGHTGRLEST